MVGTCCCCYVVVRAQRARCQRTIVLGCGQGYGGWRLLRETLKRHFTQTKKKKKHVRSHFQPKYGNAIFGSLCRTANLHTLLLIQHRRIALLKFRKFRFTFFFPQNIPSASLYSRRTRIVRNYTSKSA